MGGRGGGQNRERIFDCGFRNAECGLEDSESFINPRSEIRIPHSYGPLAVLLCRSLSFFVRRAQNI
jgi:hypothetical protein